MNRLEIEVRSASILNMKQFCIKISVCLAVLMVFSACSSTRRPRSSNIHGQIARMKVRYEDEISSLKKSIGELRIVASERDALRVKRESLEKRVRNLEKEVSVLESDKKSLVAQQGFEVDGLSLSSEKIKELERERDQIRKQLQKYVDLNKIGVDLTPLGIRITVKDSILFDSAKAELRRTSDNVLKSIAGVLKKSSVQEIRIAGHTDNRRIRSEEFPSNWELSTARAEAVLHGLVDDYRLPGSRFVVMGYGPYRPFATNTTDRGRIKNRRVDIYLVPNKSGS